MPIFHPNINPIVRQAIVFEDEKSVVLNWKIERQHLFLRSSEHGDEIVWAFLGCADLARELKTLSQQDELQHVLQNAWKSRLFWRVFIQEKHLLFLRKNFGLLQTDCLRLIRFDFKKPLSKFLSAASDEIQQCLDYWREAESWSKLSSTEVAWQMIEFHRGARAEFEPLLQAAFVLAQIQPCNYPLDLQRKGKSVLRTEPLHFQSQIHFHSFIEGKERIQPFFDLLNQHFELHRTTEDWREHDEYGDPKDFPCPSYSIVEPSQHEKLEAFFVWRNFLRGKMSESQIQQFLPQI